MGCVGGRAVQPDSSESSRQASPPFPHGPYAAWARPPGRGACAEAPPLRPSPTPTPAAASSATSLFLFALSSSCFLFPPPPRLLFSSSSSADARVGPWRQSRGGGATAARGISRGCRRRCFPFSPAVSAESAECVLRPRNTHLLFKKSKKNLKKSFKKPKKNLQKIRVSPAGDFYFFFFLFYKITR